MSIEYPPIDRREGLRPDEFCRRYVGREPVVLAGVIAGLPALARWTLESLVERAGSVEVRVKRDSATQPTAVQSMSLRRYSELLRQHEADSAAGRIDAGAVPPYLHDTLLIADHPELLLDLGGFPAQLLPAWYHRQWWRLALCFIGGLNSLTPMHCDTLQTHNLFFQVLGHKRFIIVAPEDRRQCYRRGWRWSSVDAEAPDYDRFPRFRAADARECTLGPGDAVYIPPRAFHQVRGLDRTISFAVDWHTRRSALAGVAAVLRGMPISQALHNGLHTVGLLTGLPISVLYPLYERHLRGVD